ncbi:hypothetical protein PR048_020543 [Dryococelus australis]|uniref:NADH dehydrogenase [ubiquinone] 1 alpha subcomplex subunit 11 n=1 Tax=Dryococelus australis TaxID=614101 RepID=A0ABQ9H6L8_9NEOP|nr:hypothetical protein PR048_020543 [Dryococelus australis]
MNYEYYNSPEGEDCGQKLFYTTKLAGLAGLGISFVDCLLLSQPKGVVRTLGRVGYFTFPFVGMATAFTTTTCLATNLRHKDDKINYALGAIAAGSIFGTWQKSILGGFVVSIAFTAFAVAKKASIEDGWEFFPEIHYRQRLRHDFTLRKQRPGNWKVSETE